MSTPVPQDGIWILVPQDENPTLLFTPAGNGAAGGGGVSDHGALTGLADDDHTQYHNDTRGDARYSGLAHTHTGTYEPANANLQAHVGSTANPHSVTAAQAGADATGTAAAAVVAHAGATDPHGDRSFATSAVSTHSALTTGAHGITAAGAALLDDVDAAAQRTTLGLGTAATQASSAFEASGAVSTHNAVTTAHGISAYGATLVDDADAATARTTLGLGTAATSASGDFATAGHNHSGVYQPADAELTAIAGLTSAADKGIQFTGSGTAATFDLTAAARTVLDDTTTAAMLATLGGISAAATSDVNTGTSTALGVTPGAYKDSTPYYVDRTADWTLALTDRNKDQWFNNGASALVCTIPLNATVAFAVGDTIPLVRLASGTATIDAATSVTLNGVSGGSCTISTRYQGALLKKIATDSWVVSGDVSAVA